MTVTAIRPLAGSQRLLGSQAPTWREHVTLLGPVPSMSSDQLVALVEAAGLTGRGGAGFPTARKLKGIAAARRAPVVVGNAMEGELLSHKDRTLLERAPHLVLDGLQIVGQTLGARRGRVAEMPRRLPRRTHLTYREAGDSRRRRLRGRLPW